MLSLLVILFASVLQWGVFFFCHLRRAAFWAFCVGRGVTGDEIMFFFMGLYITGERLLAMG